MQPAMPDVVLLRVEHPGNLGAVARAMANFGFERLVLVEPRCDPASVEATGRAKHAAALLRNATAGDARLLDEYDLVVGTTGRLGNDYNLPRTPLLPGQLAERLAVRSGRVALLFGPESDGLLNEDLARCDVTVSIPTTQEYSSMNLSHAVAVMLYAIREAALAQPVAERYPLVKTEQKAQIKKYIDGILERYEFTVESRLETQRILWQRLVGKSFLTQREAMALLGFLRKIRG